MPLRPDDRDFLPQLARYRAIGATVVILNVSCDCDVILQPFAMIESFRGWLSARPDEYVLGSSVADIERAKREGKLAVFFDVEGGIPVQDEPETVGRLYALGVRWMLLAYNRNNMLGGGCPAEAIGLTAQGRGSEGRRGGKARVGTCKTGG